MEKQIASIYFEQVKAERQYARGPYIIPAVPQGADPFILKISDMIQIAQEAGPDGKTKVVARYPVTGEEIAACLIREWTLDGRGMVPGVRGPGIWVVRDSIPVLDEDGKQVIDFYTKAAQFTPATAEQKTAMWAEDLANARRCDAAWAEWLVQEADILGEKPETQRLISQPMRTAARHYGYEREWTRDSKNRDNMVPCPFCTKTISAKSIKCQYCTEIVNPQEYAKQIARREAAIEAAKRGVVTPPVQTGKQPAAA